MYVVIIPLLIPSFLAVRSFCLLCFKTETMKTNQITFNLHYFSKLIYLYYSLFTYHDRLDDLSVSVILFSKKNQFQDYKFVTNKLKYWYRMIQQTGVFQEVIGNAVRYS